MYVRIRYSLERSTQDFIDALADLVTAVEHADPALLEDSIAEAHERLKANLRGLAFETDDE